VSGKALVTGEATVKTGVLFEELTRRMPDLELAGAVTRLRSSWANSLISMPVSFTPGTREASGAEEVSAT
jgi:linalool 8-monooxygenase